MLAVIPLLLAALARADDMDMGSDDERPVFHPINAGSKSFHLVLALVALLVLPAAASCLAFANRFRWSLLLQYVATGYSVFELFFLSFPDNIDNHENKASTGTSFFLTCLLGLTVFLGTFIDGHNLVMNRWYSAKPTEGGVAHIAYKALSAIVVPTAWVRICLACVALLGFCYNSHTGQCIAHGIMGSAFVGYSFLLALMLVVPWFRDPRIAGRPPRYSQELFDSSIMCAWGIVNTFTEHRWGKEDWNMGDYQHTSMGIIWWAGGILGIYLSKGGRRTFVPALLLIFTGYSMSQHAQHMMLSTKVHGMFGMALMGAGASRIVEISFLLNDNQCIASGKIASFQYFPPFCLTLAGILFMAANEEQLQLVYDLRADHSAYILTASAAAFVVFSWLLFNINFYLHLVGYDENGPLDKDPYIQAEAGDFELDDMSDH